MKQAIRNILVVAFFSSAGGWLGIWLNGITGESASRLESPGALVWLVTPALSGLLLRALGGDGWRDAGLGLRLKQEWKWYILAILVYPVVAFFTFFVARSFGVVGADGFVSKGIAPYMSMAAAMFAGSLIKNLFEEFAWRGYLTPRLDAAGLHPLWNHLLVGTIWWSWHLPYYLYFLDRGILEKSITTDPAIFIATGLFVLFPTAILFGELRLLTQSVWPVYLLHSVINGLSMPLIAGGFIKVHGFWSPFLAPTNEGIVTSLLLGAVGLFLYRTRVRSVPGGGFSGRRV